jgi:subtilisin-like proprotein convertase family protein
MQSRVYIVLTRKVLIETLVDATVKQFFFASVSLVSKAGIVVPELFPTPADRPSHHVVTWQQTLAQHPSRHARGLWKLQVSRIRRAARFMF